MGGVSQHARVRGCLSMSAQGGVCPGGVCPGGCLSRGCLPRGCLPRGCLPRGVCPGGCLSGGQQTPRTRDRHPQEQRQTPPGTRVRHSRDQRLTPPNPDTMGYGQQVGGAHSTGMNSCLLNASFSSVVHVSLQKLGINTI